ncbi:MAG: hypothetical protein AB1898_07355 [Acidobacteriota bacterium]
MKKSSRFVRLALVVLLLSLSDGRSAQVSPEPVTRFRAVKAYSLFITVKSDDDMKVEFQGESMERKYKEEFTARIDLTERHLDNDYVQWEGEGVAEQILEEKRKEVHAGGHFVQETQAVGQGSSKTKVKLYIDELQKTFQVWVDTEYVSGTLSGSRKDDPKPTEPISGDTVLSTTGLRWVPETHPLPASGLALNADMPYPKEQCGDYLKDFETAQSHFDHAHLGRIKIELAPLEANPPKLILTPPEDYSRWRPTPDPANPSQPKPPVNVAAIDGPGDLTRFMLQARVSNLFPIVFRSLDALQVQKRSGKQGEEELVFGPFDVSWEVVQGSSRSKVLKVVFRLSEVSKYPGWCMNYPPVSTPDQPDLDFVPPTTHADWTLDRNSQTLTIVGQTAQAGRGKVRLQALDGAAIGVLTAEAELEGRARPVAAEIQGNQSSGRLLIPDRDEGMDIARGWKAKFARNMGDNADEDDQPEGDGQKGDGLTVWEEYRGFFVGGKWKDCDPRKKDLFIENTIGPDAQGGIDLFGKVTEIVLHDKLIPNEERRGDRVINFNKRDDRHQTDQHCLVLRKSPASDKGFIKGYFWREIVFGVEMGPPKHVDSVYVMMDLRAEESFPLGPGDPVPQNKQASHIAHELSHAVGVWHHGDSDSNSPVKWTIKEVNGNLQIFEDGSPITVLREDLTSITVPSTDLTLPTIGSIFPQYSSGQREALILLGTQSGQHSGNEDCWMKYDIADAYAYLKRPADTRIWPSYLEPKGMMLCNSRDGVRSNHTLHKPHSRYGSAAPKRGYCIHQIVVSDRWESKSR